LERCGKGPRRSLTRPVKSYYSNSGRNVIDVTAPGGDFRVPSATPSRNGRILSTVTNGGWGWKQGTSMAGPPVAGVLALIRDTDTGLQAKQAINVLEREADQLACPTFYDANRTVSTTPPERARRPAPAITVPATRRV